ncbi:hypothetical protein [Candidatus Tisiphia endosymbiont of Hybos culiciformis]|uniref:hypothetical protein n=1 Tax=Candidatus Tisiphia endosymbiont of Hybos culiciformis TaxID=3139331 RepID=UPI003CCA989D
MSWYFVCSFVCILAAKLQQDINFLPFQLVNSIDTDPVATPKQNYYTCHIIKPNGTKLIIQTLDPKIIIQTFLCCN